MATGGLQEWLVIVPDHVGALQKRIDARPNHLEGLKSDREDMWLWGGKRPTWHFQLMEGNTASFGLFRPRYASLHSFPFLAKGS